jgi:hypothetical protein
LLEKFHANGKTHFQIFGHRHIITVNGDVGEYAVAKQTRV